MRQAKAFSGIGVNGILAVIEANFSISDASVITYFRTIAEAVDCQVVLHTNPQFQCSDLSLSVIAELAEGYGLRPLTNRYIAGAVGIGDPEPAGGLDGQGQRRVITCDRNETSETVIELLVDLNRSRGITFLVVTHEEEIARQCTRIISIRDGLIVSDEKLVESADSEE